MVEHIEAMQKRLRTAMKAAGLEDSLVLVAVLRQRVDGAELEREFPTQDKLNGWAIWPSTMHIAQNRFGEELKKGDPLLDAEWVNGSNSTIRFWRDGETVNAICTQEQDPTQINWQEGYHPALRETVKLLCQTPANSRAIYHVYWILDPDRGTLGRAFDRFVGYDPIYPG